MTAVALVVLPLGFVSDPIKAQTSTGESIAVFQEKFASIKRTVITAIMALPEHPEAMESGSVSTTIETAASGDLTNLLNRLQEQGRILKEKEQGVMKNASLSQAEKQELRGELQKQSKPLQALRDKVSQFMDAINELRSSRLTTWKKTYDSFKDIYGAPKATEKLKGLVDAFCAPYALPKEEVQVQPKNADASPSPARQMAYQTTIPMTPGVTSPLATQPQFPGFLPTLDAFPFRTGEIPVNRGVVKGMRPGDGSISFTLLNPSQEKQKVFFRVIILNRDGVVLSEGDVSWVFKKLEPGAEALVDYSFKCREPLELKFSSTHAGFDLTPAWIILRGKAADEGLNGGKVSNVQRNRREERIIQSMAATAQPAAQDLIPLSQDIRVGRGVLRDIAISQGRVNVTLENTSPEKKPVKFHFYFLNRNGFIVGDHSVVWYFKQLDPGAKTIESFTPAMKVPESLRHSVHSGTESLPRWIIIRDGDDNPYKG